MKKLLLLATFVAVLTGVSAQNNYWGTNKDAAEKIVTDKAVSRLSFPKEFKLYDLQQDQMQQKLFTVVNNASRHSVVISLPNAAGQLEDFEVFEASNFDAELQAMFPTIRAFSGKSLTDPSATLKLSYSPYGIQTMVFRPNGKPSEFIEPYSQNHKVYAVFKSERKIGDLPWKCSTPEASIVAGIDQQITNSGIAGRNTGDVKTMRLAQSVTAEYSNYFGATSASQVSLVLAAVNATLTRCNGVYERDLALHLNLVAASTSVFYYNASTDPYSNASTGAGGTWSSELQSTLNSVIGAANYDIGHLFGATGGGGNAGCIGCVCTNASKGSGFTSPADAVPQGDNFDIDYVVHEVGHQLGANHTFSHSNESTGVNKEVGSGITIMGYAGITAYDVAPHSIEYYHQASIAQIQANLATKTCPITTGISGTNATPVIGALTNYTIPISTPFALTGSATDADGDPLTYSWEQNDNVGSGGTGAGSKASPTKTTGPNWLSFAPTTSPTRVFPKIETVLAGGLTTGPLTGGDAGITIEALSSVSRTLNFRLTVRDNRPYSSTAPVTTAQTNFKDMVVTVSNSSGPFAVTAPNTNVSWAGNSTQTVTWNVNNTTASPVSCANVKISLSTDGGYTFPTILTSSTANDGSETITVPNTPTTTARIKVEAVGNIFFDISNTNFTITAGGAVCDAPTGLSSSAITTSSATVNWAVVSGAVSYAVDYKLSSSSTWIAAETATTATSSALSGLADGATYDWRVRTNCASSNSAYTQAQFTTTAIAGCDAPTGLSSSAITTSSATVSWTAVSGASSYAVDYKLSSSSTWIAAETATTATSSALSGLADGSNYDWRVRTNCTSSNSAYTQAQFTTIAANGCQSAFEPNESITEAATISAGVANTAAITTSTDNDYFVITTTAASNNVFTLAGPSGVDYDLTIYNSAGTSIGTGTSSSANETITLNNQAAGTYYIRVFGYNGANSTTCYTITATVTPTGGGTGCQSSYDVSTNGSASGAATIPLNTDIYGLINPSGDNDYYKFVISTGGTATITLSNLPADYDIRLYKSNGTSQLTSSSNGGTTSETISRTFTAGTYYVRVYGYSNANHATSCYTLRVQTGTASKPEFAANEGALLKMSPNPTSNILNVSLLGSKVNQQTVLQILDVNGRVVMQQWMNRNIQTLDVSSLTGGTYMVRINNGKEVVTAKFIKQ